jgi:hypothetical protein
MSIVKHSKRLANMKLYFSSLTDEEFLAQYNSIKDVTGNEMLIKDYLNDASSKNEVGIFSHKHEYV